MRGGWDSDGERDGMGGRMGLRMGLAEAEGKSWIAEWVFLDWDSSSHGVRTYARSVNVQDQIRPCYLSSPNIHVIGTFCFIAACGII